MPPPPPPMMAGGLPPGAPVPMQGVMPAGKSREDVMDEKARKWQALNQKRYSDKRRFGGAQAGGPMVKLLFFC